MHRNIGTMKLLCWLVTLAVVITDVTVTGIDYKRVADKTECAGHEIFKDYVKDVSSCADACRNSSQMFIYGQGDKCKEGKCKCYCQIETMNFKCLTRKEHAGYNLYAFDVPDYKRVADKTECAGHEIFKDYLVDVSACADACRNSSQMFIFGQGEKCKGGNSPEDIPTCKCYCQIETMNFKCLKRKEHDGYNLYAFHAPDYSLVAQQSECAGKESLRGATATVAECASTCRGLSEMFVFGTNRFGRNRCHSGKCKCYCQQETKDLKCKKRIQHKGFDLYAFRPRDYTRVADKVECEGASHHAGYVSGVQACADACRNSSQLFTYGTNIYRHQRCVQGKCKCYCMLETTDYECNKTKVHTGYIMYSYKGLKLPGFSACDLEATMRLVSCTDEDEIRVSCKVNGRPTTERMVCPFNEDRTHFFCKGVQQNERIKCCDYFC